jgi:hypothetical protein
MDTTQYIKYIDSQVSTLTTQMSDLAKGTITRKLGDRTHESPLDTRPVCYVLPSEAASSRVLIRAFCVIIASYFHYASGQHSDAKWMGLVASYLSAIFPSFFHAQSPITRQTLTNENVTELLRICCYLEGQAGRPVPTGPLLGAPLTDATILPAVQEFLSEVLGCRGTEVTTVARLWEPREGPELAGYASLLVFLMVGKTDPAMLKGIHTTRPLAIKKKYLDAHYYPVLFEKEWRLGEHTIKAIGNAWNRMASFRSSVVATSITFGGQDAAQQMEVYYTTFKLMRFAGMSYYPSIVQFLLTFPFAYTLPSLRAEITYFHYCIEVLKQVEPSTREYWKLARGDAATFFRREQLSKLIGLAVMNLESKNDDLKQMDHQEHPVATEEFENARRRYMFELAGIEYEEE